MDMRVKLLAEALRLESDLVSVAFEVSAPERVWPRNRRSCIDQKRPCACAALLASVAATAWG